MARPNKYRRICELPDHQFFGPKGKPRTEGDEAIVLTVDEYEVLRLIDYEALNQEECAAHMEVARSTIQRVYNIARKKLMTMMVEGRDINIQGGNYKICDGQHEGKGCGNCRRNRGR